jgi:threonine/homoserine/homoserine lactone efflux protein
MHCAGPLTNPPRVVQWCGIFTAFITFTGPLLLWMSTLCVMLSLMRASSGNRRGLRDSPWLSGAVLTSACVHTCLRIVCLARWQHTPCARELIGIACALRTQLDGS